MFRISPRLVQGIDLIKASPKFGHTMHGTLSKRKQTLWLAAIDRPANEGQSRPILFLASQRIANIRIQRHVGGSSKTGSA